MLFQLKFVYIGFLFCFAEEYMEPFTQLVNESIASCVTFFATHADTEAR